MIPRRFEIDAAILGREHIVLIQHTSAVEYMLGTKQNNLPTSADNPGVAVLPPLLYGAVFIVVLALRWLWPMPIFGHAVALCSGASLIVFAVAIAIWGRRTMHAAGTNISPLRPTTVVVTTGPFRFSRNPLYLALTFLYLGLTFVFNTWWGIIVLIPLCIIMHRGVVLREERYLEQKFGETYRRYRSSVRRYL